jgi:hypothetical protein
MFANLLQLITRRPPPDYSPEFIKEVNIRTRTRRHPKVERLLWICWLLIIVKCVVVFWACAHYHVPFNPLWVVAPTVLFAAVCTAVYYWRD